MILRPHVTPQGYSDHFPLYDQADDCTPRYDVHVRVEPGDDTVAALMIYDRHHSGGGVQPRWIDCAPTDFYLPTRQRIAAAVWKRYGKSVPEEVLS